jgi:large subunit ribosomal protein L1
VEFRLDRTAIIHVPFGKASFEREALLDNLATLVDAIQKAKPAGAKGQYIRTINIATSMGPGIKLDLTPTLSLTPP